MPNPSLTFVCWLFSHAPWPIYVPFAVCLLVGLLSLATLLGAYAIYTVTLVSAWCSFAALLSFIVYAYFRRARFPDRSLSPALDAARA